MTRCHVCSGALISPESDVICDGCELWSHRACWRQHWCGVLTDRNGRLVVLGTTLQYWQSVRVYQVSKIPGTFIRGGTCYGIRKDKKGIYDQEIIRPRMMEVIN